MGVKVDSLPDFSHGNGNFKKSNCEFIFFNTVNSCISQACRSTFESGTPS